MALAAVRSKAVALLFIATPIVGFCYCSMFCCAALYVHSSFTIILMGKRELFVLLCLSSRCLVIGVFLFLFDLILYVHSTIFQLCGTGLPGLNQY